VRVRRAIIIGLVVVVAAIAALFIVLNITRGDAPSEFELTTSESSSTTSQVKAEVVDTEEVEVVDDAIDPTNLDGTWSITGDSQAGYRVVEDFVGGLQNFEAVGRGSGLTGSITVDGTTITTADFVIDVASITSDDTRRDDRFTRLIMNTAEFPTSTFTLLDPIELGVLPGFNEPVTTVAAGELTLRDVTNSVQVDIQAQLTDTAIEIVGSIPVLFSDYGIDNPSIEKIIEVRDEGTVEFQLFLTR